MILIGALLLAFFVLPSPWGVVVVVLAALVEVAEVSLWLAWSKRRRPRVGVETMVGRSAVVAKPCRPRGQVRLDGEIWTAVCDEGADRGEAVRIVSVDSDGLTLRVAKTPA
jgi:membrane-bound serine protease (ClpP class)